MFIERVKIQVFGENYERNLCQVGIDLCSLMHLFCIFFQLSFIQHSLMNPDVFCFADYPCHTVAIDILKAPPEDDNREIATWYGN